MICLVCYALNVVKVEDSILQWFNSFFYMWHIIKKQTTLFIQGYLFLKKPLENKIKCDC